MFWFTTLGLALGLAMDALAVAIAVGLKVQPLTRRHIFRLGFHFGLFQALMPILGWLAGRSVSQFIRSFDHWVAFTLLAIVGAKMLWEAFRHDQEKLARDPTRGWSLVMLSLATSIDALAVGLSMALLRVAVWTPALVIGLVTATLTALGIGFGSRLGERFGRLAEALGGLVLLAIGARILIGHTFQAASGG